MALNKTQQANRDLVERLANRYSFDVEDAWEFISRPKLSSSELKKYTLPWIGIVLPNRCNALTFNSGLYTQCMNKPIAGSQFCTTCDNYQDLHNKPKYGLASDRANHDHNKSVWKTNTDKVPHQYSTIVKKKSIQLTEVNQILQQLYNLPSTYTYTPTTLLPHPQHPNTQLPINSPVNSTPSDKQPSSPSPKPQPEEIPPMANPKNENSKTKASKTTKGKQIKKQSNPKDTVPPAQPKKTKTTKKSNKAAPKNKGKESQSDNANDKKSIEASPSTEVCEVKKITINKVDYLLDPNTNELYNFDTHELIGKYDPNTKAIELN